MIIISTTRESRISDNVELKENGGRIRESFPAWQDFLYSSWCGFTQAGKPFDFLKINSKPSLQIISSGKLPKANCFLGQPFFR